MRSVEEVVVKMEKINETYAHYIDLMVNTQKKFEKLLAVEDKDQDARICANVVYFSEKVLMFKYLEGMVDALQWVLLRDSEGKHHIRDLTVKSAEAHLLMIKSTLHYLLGKTKKVKL